MLPYLATRIFLDDVEVLARLPAAVINVYAFFGLAGPPISLVYRYFSAT